MALGVSVLVAFAATIACGDDAATASPDSAPVPAGVLLIGACTAETLLASSVFSDRSAVVNVQQPGVVLRNLSITSSPRPGVLVAGAGASVRLEDVVIRGVREGGVLSDQRRRLSPPSCPLSAVSARPSAGW